MALTQNQINDQFQSQLGRPATDYEYNKYTTASPQTLANLKGIYSKLNPTSSVSDYLSHSGQDSSFNNRATLASKYGIQGYQGSSDQNVALLHALQSPPPTDTTKISGSIAPATNTPPQNATATQDTTSPQQTGSVATAANPTGASTGDQAIADANNPGRTNNAIPTDSTQVQTYGTPSSGDGYTQNPLLASSLKDYQAVQSQISGIDKALASELQNKKDQVAKSGGIVNEAQLMGLIQQEQAPLIAQRRELVNQQSNLGKTYQSLLAADKQAQTQAQQQSSMAEKQREFAINSGQKDAQLALSEKKQQVQEDQFSQKLQQSGMKLVKTSVLDSYGNKVGDSVKVYDINTGKPVTIAPGSTQSKQINSVATSGVVGDPSTKSVAVVNSLTSPSYVANYKGNADAPTNENQALQVPGTTLTVGSLYQGALDWMSKPQTSGAARGQKTITINTNAAIAAKGSAILQSLGVTKTQYEASYKANSGALANQMKQYGALSVNEKAANTNFNTLISLSKKVDDTTYRNASPILEKWIQSGQVSLTGDKNVNNFVSQLTLTMTEYAKVITGQTGGAAVSDSARQEMQALLNSGLSTDAIQSYYTNVATPDINGRVNAQKDTIQGYLGGISGGTPGITENKPSPIASSDIPSGYYQASDGLLYKK